MTESVLPTPWKPSNTATGGPLLSHWRSATAVCDSRSDSPLSLPTGPLKAANKPLLPSIFQYMALASIFHATVDLPVVDLGCGSARHRRARRRTEDPAVRPGAGVRVSWW